MEIKYTNIIYIPDKKVTTLKINNILPYYCEISFLKFKHFEFNISFIFFSCFQLTALHIKLVFNLCGAGTILSILITITILIAWQKILWAQQLTLHIQDYSLKIIWDPGQILLVVAYWSPVNFYPCVRSNNYTVFFESESSMPFTVMCLMPFFHYCLSIICEPEFFCVIHLTWLK